MTAGGVTIVLVTLFEFGVLGFFLGSAIGSAVGAILGWYGIRAYVDWSRWHRSLWPGLVRFGAPLVPGSVAMYVLMTADRWFVNYHHGEEAVGIYAVGVMFALGFGMIVNTFRQAWWPMAMDHLQRPEGPEVFRTIGRLYLGVGSAAVVLLAGVSPWLLQVFTAPPFHSAYPIVGALAWQSLFYGFHMIAVAGLWKNGSTVRVTITMAVAALLNVVLDACLVPAYGSIGAAVATSFSFLVWNIVVIWMSERQWPVHYAYGVLGAQVAVGILATAGVLVLYDRGQPVWTVALVVIAAILAEIRLTGGAWSVGRLRGLRSVGMVRS